MKQVILLLVVFVARTIRCQKGEPCTPGDVDIGELAEVGIFMTSSLESKGVSEELVQKQLKENSNEAIDLIAKAEEEFKDGVEKQKLSIEYEAPVAANDRTASAAIAQELAYFHWSCPYRYYWLYKYLWTFYSKGKFCWAFYPVYVSSCLTRYCNSWSKPYIWYHYDRCVTRYVYTWIYSRCLTFKNGQLVWSTEYVRRILPRGCMCKRYYNPILIASQCPATPITRG